MQTDIIMLIKIPPSKTARRMKENNPSFKGLGTQLEPTLGLSSPMFQKTALNPRHLIFRKQIIQPQIRQPFLQMVLTEPLVQIININNIYRLRLP